MFLSKKFVLVALFAVPAFAHAAPAGAHKTYNLKNLHEVVSNHDKCESVKSNLKKLSKKPISLQFAKTGNGFGATSQQVAKHQHTILKQNAKSSALNRIVLGSFELDQQKINYIVEITGNTDNKDHKYLYPTILSAQDGHCHFTAIVEPTAETVAAFKKSINSGAASKGTDLIQK